jgi:hypothetical protein
MANIKNFKHVNSNEMAKEAHMTNKPQTQHVNTMESFFKLYGDIKIDVSMTELLEQEAEFLALKLQYKAVEFVNTSKVRGLKFRLEAKDLITDEHYNEVVFFTKLPEDVRKHLPLMLKGLLDQLRVNSLEQLYHEGSDKTAIALLTHEVSKEGKEYVKVDFTRQARADALMARDNALANK